MRHILIGRGLLAAVPAAAQDRIGPSFRCPTPRDALGQLICDNSSLSRLDLMYVQAYQALRQQVGPEGGKALRVEATEFNAETRLRR